MIPVIVAGIVGVGSYLVLGLFGKKAFQVVGQPDSAQAAASVAQPAASAAQDTSAQAQPTFQPQAPQAAPQAAQPSFQPQAAPVVVGPATDKFSAVDINAQTNPTPGVQAQNPADFGVVTNTQPASLADDLIDRLTH